MFQTQKYIGINNSVAKNLLLKTGRYRLVEREVDGLAYDCKKHISLLEDYEKGQDILRSLYFRSGTFYSFYSLRDRDATIKKMQYFLNYYERVKKGESVGPVIVTQNGARLDGSHRVGILKFLGVKKILVKEIFAPHFLLWIIGREVEKRKEVYERFKKKKAFINGKFEGEVIFTEFVRRDLLSFRGDYYHFLNTEKIVRAKQCFLEE